MSGYTAAMLVKPGFFFRSTLRNAARTRQQRPSPPLPPVRHTPAHLGTVQLVTDAPVGSTEERPIALRAHEAHRTALPSLRTKAASSDSSTTTRDRPSATHSSATREATFFDFCHDRQVRRPTAVPRQRLGCM
jgi:hypothetical protein